MAHFVFKSSPTGGYTFSDDDQEAFVSELGLPPAGADVQLVATVMDL